jgi:hypothetical protein
MYQKFTFIVVDPTTTGALVRCGVLVPSRSYVGFIFVGGVRVTT